MSEPSTKMAPSAGAAAWVLASIFACVAFVVALITGPTSAPPRRSKAS